MTEPFLAAGPVSKKPILSSAKARAKLNLSIFVTNELKRRGEIDFRHLTKIGDGYEEANDGIEPGLNGGKTFIMKYRDFEFEVQVDNILHGELSFRAWTKREDLRSLPKSKCRYFEAVWWIERHEGAWLQVCDFGGIYRNFPTEITKSLAVERFNAEGYQYGRTMA